MKTRAFSAFSAFSAVGVALLVVAVAAPGVSSAAAPTESIYTRILTVYQSKGTIDPCEFSASQLESALKALGTAGGQYFGDFVQAVQTALSTRAARGCPANRSGAGGRAKGGSSTGGSLTGVPVGGSAGPPLPEIPLTSASDAGVPAPLIAMAVLAGVIAVLSAAVTLVRRTGIDPGWAAAGRHSAGEAADRIGAAWEDFADWQRSGRQDRGGPGVNG